MKITRIVFFLILLPFLTNSKSNEKTAIISKLKEINNIQFNFVQKTNQTIEKGNCALVFPNKLKCFYQDKNKKELIVNKNMMAVTQKRYEKTLFYPLSKSDFINILDKEELINIIKKNKIIVDEYFNIIFLGENNSKILIKFNKKDFSLAGWSSLDQYNNQIEFDISIVSTNQKINNKIFVLPNKN